MVDQKKDSMKFKNRKRDGIGKENERDKPSEKGKQEGERGREENNWT